MAQQLTLHTFIAMNPGTVPGQGTKTPKVDGHGQKGGVDLDIDTHAGRMLYRHGDGLL